MFDLLGRMIGSVGLIMIPAFVFCSLAPPRVAAPEELASAPPVIEFGTLLAGQREASSLPACKTPVLSSPFVLA